MEKITNFTNGEIYKNRSAFNVQTTPFTDNTKKPFPVFSVMSMEETVVFDKRKYSFSEDYLFYALTQDIVTDIDKNILYLIATFFEGITTKMLADLLVLLGLAEVETAQKITQKSVSRLGKYGLIDAFRYQLPDKSVNPTAMRVFILTPRGARLVKSTGIQNVFFNAMELSERESCTHKKNCATAQAVIAFLKHMSIESFSFEKIRREAENCGVLVKPSAEIVLKSDIGSETLFFQTVRRTPWQPKTSIQKLGKFERYSEYVTDILHSWVFIGEDEEHTRSLYLAFCEAGFPDSFLEKIIFTHDLNLYGNFKNAFYSYSKEATLIPLRII